MNHNSNNRSMIKIQDRRCAPNCNCELSLSLTKLYCVLLRLSKCLEAFPTTVSAASSHAGVQRRPAAVDQ